MKQATKKKTKKRGKTGKRELLWTIFAAVFFAAVCIGYFGLVNGWYDGLLHPEPYLEYGSDTSNSYDPDFTHPDTKNNLDLAAFAEEVWDHRWGYVWGTFGYVLTEERLQMKLDQYPEVGEYEDFIRANWLDRRTTDCAGLVKAYCWYDPAENDIGYCVNGVPDCGTEELFAAAEKKGRLGGVFRRIPEVPGLLVYAPGHVGVYIGDGYVIEAHSTEVGVVKTKLSQRHFRYWFECPYIEYISE